MSRPAAERQREHPLIALEARHTSSHEGLADAITRVIAPSFIEIRARNLDNEEGILFNGENSRQRYCGY